MFALLVQVRCYYETRFLIHEKLRFLASEKYGVSHRERIEIRVASLVNKVTNTGLYSFSVLMSNPIASKISSPRKTRFQLNRNSISQTLVMSGKETDANKRKAGNSSKDEDEPDWREEMRAEIKSCIASALNTSVSAAVNTAVEAAMARQPFNPPLGPSEIDAEDVVDKESSESMADLMKKIDAGNRSNKIAIRLAAISKEGNKQHFMDMIEIKEKLECAEAALKESTVDLYKKKK